MRNLSVFLLPCILILGLLLRLYAINWDYGFHLHPDERAILLFTLPLQFPTTFAEFFSPESLWNPHFFAYGSFPLYLLKIVSSFGVIFDTTAVYYDGMHVVGRILSALFDTGTIFILYLLTKKLFSRPLALVASFFYATAVLPIQLSHFYTVDTILTFFIVFLLYQLIKFYNHPSKVKAVGIGILFGFALATKSSAFVVVTAIVVSISIDFLFIFLKQPHKPYRWSPHVPAFLKRLLIDGALITVAAVGTFFLLEPYAFIDAQAFWQQTFQQAAMTKSAFTFPYTLQYVGKIPYLYEIHNIFLWGLGPVLAISCISGIVFYHIQLIKKHIQHWQAQIILLSFFWIYFVTVGSFAVGFMRYMLPLYPFLCLFAAFFCISVYTYLKQKHEKLSYMLSCSFLFLLLLWPLSFIHIYSVPPTRVSATQWILQHIPPGKTLAIEHWDDALPLTNQERYRVETLELYQSDTTEKWEKMRQQLAVSDYIIIASNRLYTPLQKLTDCSKLPYPYCYTQTATYYQNLFSGKLGFRKIAEFSVYPKIPIIGIPIRDDTADESFTVYDHPKIMIFKNLKN